MKYAVMIDVDGGNNLLYLPLDKIMQQTQEGSSSSSATRGNQSNPEDFNSSRNNRRDRR